MSGIDTQSRQTTKSLIVEIITIRDIRREETLKWLKRV